MTMNISLSIRNLLLLLVVVPAVSACISTRAPEDMLDIPFEHQVTGRHKPWNKESFDAASGKFTFAVFSDLTGGERAGIFEIAIEQLNLLRPELIVNVGDLVEGGTDAVATIDGQWDSFDERAGKARAPVFYVGGNHDRGSQVMQGVWERRYGPGYYWFVYKDVLFLVLDTEDHPPARMQEIVQARSDALKVVDSEGWDAFAETDYARMPENLAGNVSDAQARFFQAAIAAHPDVRWTFLFMHKSPWLREDMTSFRAIEAALAGRPYTLFNGHVHAYQHLERQGRDYIRLATTGGVQLPANGRSMDHVTLVTVDGNDVDIANLLLNGILDKHGQVPLQGDTRCFEIAVCGEPGS